MNDNQLEILRQFVAEKHQENSQRLHDADKRANRRSKFIWHPYVSLNHRFETEQASKSINDLIDQNPLVQDVFLNDSVMKAFLVECARLKNRPKR